MGRWPRGGTMLGTPSVRRKTEPGRDGCALTRSIAFTRPSQMFVEFSGSRASIVERASLAFSGVMTRLALSTVASVVNLTMESLSLGLRSLMAVLAACLVMSRMERPVSSAEAPGVPVTEAGEPIEPLTSITRMRWVAVRDDSVDAGGDTVTLRRVFEGKAEEVEREDDRSAGEGPLTVRFESASGGGSGGMRGVVPWVCLMVSRRARLGVSWSGVREERVIGDVGLVDSHSRMADRS
mmetsp:Transcript_16407/g.32655  ORF Transcript_16407/g.32655 Transcript_16407/m.32655 type:complete len:238 (+) Transcript_16407:1653-2366(+)